MSIQSSQNNIDRVDHEITRLEKQIADQVKKESDISKKQNQTDRSITKNTSLSSLKLKQNQLVKLQSDLANVLKKKADLTKKISEKKKQKTRYLQQLNREIKRENNRQEQADRRRRQDELNHQKQITSELQRQKGLTDEITNQTAINSNKSFDFFISHASEDKDDFVRLLADKLSERGCVVWYDEAQLKIGDSLRRSIDQGLINSRYAIVVLSTAFFKKNWTQYELDGLVTKEMNGVKVILPIWHKVSKDEVTSYSPSLADKLALNTSLMSVDEIANELHELIK